MTRALGLLRFAFSAWLRPVRGLGIGRKVVHYGLSVVTTLAALLTVYLIWAGWLYPLRPGAIEHLAHPFADSVGTDSWGGPTLAGAWLVHAAIAVAMQAAALGVIALCRRVIEPRHAATAPAASPAEGLRR